MAQGENARLSASVMQKSPVNRYQTPAATMGRGRKRQDENTPRLKMTCHRPGNIQIAAGVKRTSTRVMSVPTPTDGRNCSTAIRIISSAMPEWMRRVRACISVPIKAADSTAVEIQIARYAEMFLVGLGSQNACAPAAAI